MRRNLFRLIGNIRFDDHTGKSIEILLGSSFIETEQELLVQTCSFKERKDHIGNEITMKRLHDLARLDGDFLELVGEDIIFAEKIAIKRITADTCFINDLLDRELIIGFPIGRDQSDQSQIDPFFHGFVSFLVWHIFSCFVPNAIHLLFYCPANDLMLMDGTFCYILMPNCSLCK